MEYTGKGDLNIGVVGGKGCGKTNLIKRYILGKYEEYPGSKGCLVYKKSIIDRGRTYILHIRDIPNLGSSTSDRNYEFVDEVDGFIFVFAIDNKHSFLHLQTIYQNIMRRYQNKRPPCLLVGTKMDLILKTQVTSRQASQLARFWLTHYYQTSALQYINISI